MRNKLLTTLKLKIQRLIPFPFLLMVGVAAYADYSGSASGPAAVYLDVDGTSAWYNLYNPSYGYTSCSNYANFQSKSTASTDLGTVSSLKLKGFARYGWVKNTNNDGAELWIAGQLEYKIDDGSSVYYKVGNYGERDHGKYQQHCQEDKSLYDGYSVTVGYDNSNEDILSGLTPGRHTLKMKPYGIVYWHKTDNSYGEFGSESQDWVTLSFTVGCDSYDARARVVSGDDVMFYIDEDNYGFGMNGANSKTGVVYDNDTKCALATRIGDTSYGYVTMSSANVESTINLTNNWGGWTGQYVANNQTSELARGSLYRGGSRDVGRKAATTVSVVPSSSSIQLGTSSINLSITGTSNNAKSVYNNLDLYALIYVDGTKDGCIAVSTSAQTYPLTTSGLSAGSHTIKTILTDGMVDYIGDTFTLDVTSCDAPTATTGSATAAASSPFNSVTLTGTVAHDASCATTASGIILYEESTCETELARKTTASDVGTVTNLSFTFTTSDYSGLSAGATYWYKAFATNEGGSSYGNAGSVKLNCTAPTKALYTMAAGQSAVYNGSGHAPTISVTSGAGAVTKIWAKTSSDANWTDYGLTGPVNVGEYSIKVDVDGTATTYCATDGIELDNTFSITQATPSTLTISTGNSSICSSPITLGVSGATEFTATPVYEIVNDASTTGTGSITNGVLTVTAAGDFKIRATKTDPAGNYTTAVATKVITVSDLPTTGITAVWNSGSESVWADKWADDRRTLTLTYPETGHYYQWVTCNSSGDEVVNSNVTFGSATAFTTTATLNLPGTYYFKCKVSCTDNGEKIASELVTFTTPMPEFGISGPFRYGGNWSDYKHCDAGISIGESHGGLFTYAGIMDGYHTWSGTFKANKASGEFIIIQRYKRRCLCTECNDDTYMGWSGYKECNNTCSKSGTSTTTGSNANKINPSTVTLHDITGGTGNWTKSSSFPLSDGDIATIIVKMTGYDTYDVTLSQGCSTPSITVDPQTGDDISVCSSDAPTLSVTATSGTDPLTYQWYRTIESTATSGSSVTDAVSGTGANTYKPSASDMGEFRYYCIVRSAGACSAFSATSDVSKKIEIKQTPVVVPASKTVKQFEPVRITASNSSVTWAITTPAAANVDQYYLYDATKSSVMFKGDNHGATVAGTSYVITATTTGGSGCTATSNITVQYDDTECQ